MEFIRNTILTIYTTSLDFQMLKCKTILAIHNLKTFRQQSIHFQCILRKVNNAAIYRTVCT